MIDPSSASNPTDDPLMSIGTFSRASLVSIKALRSYHDLGLLVPDSIDPATGYRFYRVSQLPDAEIIRRLRQLDLPLRAIADVMEARDPEVTRKVIAEHETAMRARLDEVTKQIAGLQEALELPSVQTPVHVRSEPARHVLASRGTVIDDDYATFLGDAFGRLWAAVNVAGVVLDGPSMAVYPHDVTGEAEQVAAMLPVAAARPLPEPVVATGVSLDLVPAATCAVMTHAGGFDTIGETYRQLGAWVARHADDADLPVREYYVVSIDMATGELLPDEQLRTEIAWPIHTID